jgi:hypothetical protein
VHFGLAAESCHALAKSTPVHPDGLAEGVIALKDSSKFEGENSGIAEAGTDNSCVLDCGFLIQLTGCVVVFANDHSEFTTGVAENSGAVNSLYTF